MCKYSGEARCLVWIWKVQGATHTITRLSGINNSRQGDQNWFKKPSNVVSKDHRTPKLRSSMTPAAQKANFASRSPHHACQSHSKILSRGHPRPPKILIICSVTYHINFVSLWSSKNNIFGCKITYFGEQWRDVCRLERIFNFLRMYCTVCMFCNRKPLCFVLRNYPKESFSRCCTNPLSAITKGGLRTLQTAVPNSPLAASEAPEAALGNW